VSRNIEYASAIKSVWPDTEVFGPVVSGDGIFYSGDYSDPHLPTAFTDYYLGQMVDAGTQGGVALLDSYDFHFYTVGQNSTDCLAMPRSFWDPNIGAQYSASQLWNIFNGYYPDGQGFFTEFYPPQIISRMLTKIDTAYAGSNLAEPGLSLSEYNFGCETTIAGGVAEADGLGVFGREGLYASTVWPLQSLTGNYLPPAFDLYRNYDGSGSTVGDLAVGASTSDTANTSVYAFAHTGNKNQLELVAINKSSTATTIGASIANAASFTTATAYNLVSGNPAVVPAGSSPSLSCTGSTCSLGYTLPAVSATTIVLR
jgi:mannan endo-1,4-beta-mannosidase